MRLCTVSLFLPTVPRRVLASLQPSQLKQWKMASTEEVAGISFPSLLCCQDAQQSFTLDPVALILDRQRKSLLTNSS